MFAVQKMNRFLMIVFSFLIVAFAQPDWSLWACLAASSFGYALFWKGLGLFTSKKARFFVALFWFGMTTIIHLNWFLADRYVGFYIYYFILFLFLWLGAQFGVLSLMITAPSKMGWLRMGAICGLWALIEWHRLYILTGFSWDPVGLSLTATLYGLQMASLVGVFGLSFWVILTNLLAFNWMSKISFKNISVWVIALSLPYLYGSLHLTMRSHQMLQDQRPPLSALLVQTSLLPEEKVPVDGSIPLTPAAQWTRILGLLSPYFETSHDVIVLPEGSVPYGTYYPLYHQDVVFQTFKECFQNVDFMPKSYGTGLGNNYWAQALANAYRAHVVIGLEDRDRIPANGTFNTYNAAFLFRPSEEAAERYEKRVLVPMGEYIPFNWCKKILSKYGIMDSFQAGKEAKIFTLGKSVSAGISICYEETFGGMMRSNRKKGADVLINITNDVWYPRSRLPYVHYLHGRLRAVEEGIPMLRACNTGVTCGIDSLGRVVAQLPFESGAAASQPGVLSVELPLYSYPTLYQMFGDWIVVIVSFGCLLLHSLLKYRKFLHYPRQRMRL